MNKTIITSFTSMMTSEGETIAYTYSVINEDGEKIIENARRSLVLVNDQQVHLIRQMKDFLLTKVGD
ncbi:MAG: hypothetical protein ACLRVU_03380 [Beduini sp.]|uniref:hypothetical protein n=1 Tax=Beduini sp. TaxID=1922300 RepID=UPI0039A3EA13